MYSIALPGPFQFDDYATVAVDPGARSFAAWWAGAARHVRPLTKLSFALTYAFGDWLGHVPAGHRLGNVLIHLSALVLFYSLGRRLARSCLPDLDERAADHAALGAAAILGIHPLATEAVSYISGRSMALGSLLAAASLYAYLRWRIDGGVRWLLSALAACGGAILARESALITPLFWFAWEAARQHPNSPPYSLQRLGEATRRVAWAAPITVVAVMWLAVHARYALLLERSRQIAAGQPLEPTWVAMLQYFSSALALLRYPTIDPDVNSYLLSFAERVGIMAVVAAVTVVAWRLRRAQPLLLFVLIWIGLWLAPLYLVPVRHDAVAERHFYPAIWGLAYAICLGARQWVHHSRKRRVAITAVAVVVGSLLVVVTVTRNADYRSEIALWEAAERGAPNKVRVLNNLGVAYMEAGRWDDARRVLARGVALDPGDERARDNLSDSELRELGPVRWVRMRE